MYNDYNPDDASWHVEPIKKQLSPSSIVWRFRKVACIAQVSYTAELHWERNEFDLNHVFN